VSLHKTHDPLVIVIPFFVEAEAAYVERIFDSQRVAAVAIGINSFICQKEISDYFVRPKGFNLSLLELMTFLTADREHVYDNGTVWTFVPRKGVFRMLETKIIKRSANS
jgi:hypothetical protein